MKPGKKTQLSDITVWDQDVMAPEWFSEGRTAVDTLERMSQFVKAMTDLDRAVLIKLDEDDNLYLSSLPAHLEKLVSTDGTD